jgi:tetratricopeptide (TPR) repeat protein
LFCCAGIGLLCALSGVSSARPAADSLQAVIPAATDTFAYVRYLFRISSGLIARGEGEQAAQYAVQARELAHASGDEEGVALALLHEGNAYAVKGNGKKALASFIQSLKLKNSKRNRKLSEKLYYGMAVTFARLKQYPLALKYFHRAALQQDNGKEQVPAAGPEILPEMPDDDSLFVKDATGDFELYDNLLDITADGRIVVDQDTVMVDMAKDKKSRNLLLADITDPFDDGKEALAYGVLLHIKQPVAGTRKTFTGINTVGHMFITLTKFNADSGYVSRTFGFYPDKDYLLSATPLLPVSTSVFKDDEGHDWDEIVAKFISRRKFNRILRMVKRYSRRKYHLNKNNCTDFGLVVAGIAGIRIEETKGKWPLGGGNNPADAGQSIREGKLEHLDNGQLFIYPPPADKAP